MSLFSRAVNPAESERRIPIHALQSAVSELEAGRMTFAEVAANLELSAAEQTDLSTFLTKLANVTDSAEKLRVSARLFNYLCLGELEGGNRWNATPTQSWVDEDDFWAAVDAECGIT